MKPGERANIRAAVAHLNKSRKTMLDHTAEGHPGECNHNWTHNGDGALYCELCGVKDSYSND